MSLFLYDLNHVPVHGVGTSRSHLLVIAKQSVNQVSLLLLTFI